MKNQAKDNAPAAATAPDAQSDDAQSSDAQSYGARSKKHFKSEIAFRIVKFDIEDLERYTRLAQEIGFTDLKEFLEMECQKALFALSLEDKPT